MFRASLHWSGKPRSLERPCPVGPRNSGQSLGAAATLARASNSTAAAFPVTPVIVELAWPGGELPVKVLRGGIGVEGC